jgi:hypothetical protein
MSTTAIQTPETPQAKAASVSPKFPRPQGVSSAAVLMQAPGGTPRWIEPANMAAAKAVGAEAVQ